MIAMVADPASLILLVMMKFFIVLFVELVAIAAGMCVAVPRLGIRSVIAIVSSCTAVSVALHSIGDAVDAVKPLAVFVPEQIVDAAMRHIGYHTMSLGALMAATALALMIFAVLLGIAGVRVVGQLEARGRATGGAR